MKTKALISNTLKNIYENKFYFVTVSSTIQFFIILFWKIILSFLFWVILQASGQVNITKDNFFHLFTNIYSVSAIIFFIIILAFLIFLEFAFLTFMAYSRIYNTNIQKKEIIKNTFEKIKMLFGVQIIFFIFYFIIMIPVANIWLSSVFTENIYIPDFITWELTKTTTGTIGYIIGTIILLYINLRLIFVLPLTIIENHKLSENIKISWKITKKHQFRLIWTWIVLILLFSIVIWFFVVLLYGILLLIRETWEHLLTSSIFLTIVEILLFFMAAISKIVIIVSLVVVLWKKKILEEKWKKLSKKEKKISKILLVIILISIINLFIFNYNFLKNKPIIWKNIEVVAHRGYVHGWVENSLESLEAAAKLKPNYVELDIITTKDNKFVVSHDYDLKRLAWIKKKIKDLNADEIIWKTIKQNWFVSKIVSFEDFVKKAKELNVNLFVELKPHKEGESPDYIDKVISKMRELWIDKTSKIISLNLKVLEEINKKAPEIKVWYIVPILFWGFWNNNVDFYLVEDFSFSENMVTQVKKENKKLYVWTVNNENKIVKYLQEDVDWIITDELELVNELKNNKRENIFSILDTLWL